MCKYFGANYILFNYFLDNINVNNAKVDELIKYGYNIQKREGSNIYYDLSLDSLYTALYENKSIFNFDQIDTITLKIPHERLSRFFATYFLTNEAKAI